jgi:hypothetical protein
LVKKDMKAEVHAVFLLELVLELVRRSMMGCMFTSLKVVSMAVSYLHRTNGAHCFAQLLIRSRADCGCRWLRSHLRLSGSCWCRGCGSGGGAAAWLAHSAHLLS